MGTRNLLLAPFVSLLLLSCSVDGRGGSVVPEDQTNKLVRKWYIDPLDDRLSYDFSDTGALQYHYSRQGQFLTETGSWSYRNKDHTSVVIRLPNEVDQPNFTLDKTTIDAWYTIASEMAASIVLVRDSTGPSGRGLGSTTELLKAISGPSRILPALVGKWYYDSTKDGRWLYFEETGNCFYYHYQIVPGDGWWVQSAGVWSYNLATNSVTIYMNGELDYPYPIDELTSTTLRLGVTEKGAGMVYSAGALYR